MKIQCRMSKGPTRQKHSVRSNNSRRYEHTHNIVLPQELVLNGHLGNPSFNDVDDRKRSHERYTKSSRYNHRYFSLSCDEEEKCPNDIIEPKKRRKMSPSRCSKTTDRHLSFSKSSPIRVISCLNKAKSPRDSNSPFKKHTSTALQNTKTYNQRKSSNEKIRPSSSSTSLHRSAVNSAPVNNELYERNYLKNNNSNHKLSPKTLNSSQPAAFWHDPLCSSTAVEQVPVSVSPPSPASSFARSIFENEVEPQWSSSRRNDMHQSKQPATSNKLASIDHDDTNRGGVYIPDLEPLFPAGSLNALIMVPSAVGADEDDGMDLASSPPICSPVASSLHLEPTTLVTPIKQEPPRSSNTKPANPIIPPQSRKKEVSLTDTFSISGPSAGIELSKATRAQNIRLQQQRNKLMPIKRITLPPLHLHLSEDGTSPLPPGWQRAPNTAKAASTDDNAAATTTTYPYYYYHSRTRQTRWDPPVYPWDVDPDDKNGYELDDPEAPYNWQCAHRFAVTHEEIDAMYSQLRSRILEKQCMELLHELGGRPDAPQGAQEQSFAIELYALVHNELRHFRDARVKLGRIASDEDLYYLTRKLAQCIILKEVQNLHADQAATSSRLFSTFVAEVTPSIKNRASTYIRKYMEAKGSCYRSSSSHHYLHRSNNNQPQAAPMQQQHRPK